MRYVAVTRLDLQAPVHIVGVGETMIEAQRGAVDWFDRATDKGLVHGTSELIAFQGRMAIMTEQDLLAQSGVGLDEWLARGAARGEAPGSTEEKAPAPVEPQHPKENRLIDGLKDLALAVVMLIALPVGLTFWQAHRHGILDGRPGNVVAAAIVVMVILRLGIREYVAFVLLMQVVVRLHWEVTGGSIWLGLLSLLFI
jgi:hypothetical protein